MSANYEELAAQLTAANTLVKEWHARLGDANSEASRLRLECWSLRRKLDAANAYIRYVEGAVGGGQLPLRRWAWDSACHEQQGEAQP